MLFRNMKILFKILLSAVILFSSAIPAFSMELNTRDEYLFDVRKDDGDIYRSRISLDKKITAPEVEISAFVESQWNLDTDEWEKVLLGIEAGKTFWEYLYMGQSLQLISGQMLDYMAFDADSKSFDTTTKIKLTLPITECFSFCAFEEYSINVAKGRDEINEIGSEIIYDPGKLFSVSVGWRHTDRIHNFDTDYASMSLSFHF